MRSLADQRLVTLRERPSPPGRVTRVVREANLDAQTGAGTARAAAPAPSIKIKSLKPTPLLQIRLAVIRLAVVLALISTVRYFWWRIFHTMKPPAGGVFLGFLGWGGFDFLGGLLF